MTTTVQQDAVKAWVIPGIVVLCLYLGLSLYQNGLVLRLALSMLNAATSTEFGSFASLAMLFTIVEIAAAFAAIALLVLVRRSFVPYVAAGALLWCGYPGYWLQNLILSAFRPDHRVVVGELSGWVVLDLAIELIGAVWLLKSRNVRTFFNHRLLPETFA